MVVCTGGSHTGDKGMEKQVAFSPNLLEGSARGGSFFSSQTEGVATMTNDHVLLDAFADAGRSWDDLIRLQPGIKAGGRNLTPHDLAELVQRVEAHQAAIDSLLAALQTQPAETRVQPHSDSKSGGISNRESADEEADERRRHPPVDTDSPPPEDAAGRVGEQPLTDTRDRHTSHKAGSRSIAQKESESKYADRSMPASRKVAGAFGREPKD
jgi:hypothetical protein